MGSAAGAEKVAAARVGLDVEGYRARVAAGKKWCTFCKAWHPREEFHADATRGDGLKASCQRLGRRKPKQLMLVPVTKAERQRIRYATDADYRDHVRRRVHARARKVGTISKATVERMLDLFEGGCAYCGAPAEGWDHIVPVSQGGNSLASNILPACTGCNSRKKALNVFDFIERYRIPLTERLQERLCFAISIGQLE